jgi:hypothetical protein
MIVPVLIGSDPGDGHAGPDRRCERAALGVEEVGDLAGGHVAVRNIASVGEAGQPDHPVGVSKRSESHRSCCIHGTHSGARRTGQAT